MFVTAEKSGGWILVKGVDFSDGGNGNGTQKLTAYTSGNGEMEVRLDSIKDTPAGSVKFSSKEMNEVSINFDEPITGKHDLYLLISGGASAFSWKCQTP